MDSVDIGPTRGATWTSDTLHWEEWRHIEPATYECIWVLPFFAEILQNGAVVVGVTQAMVARLRSCVRASNWRRPRRCLEDMSLAQDVSAARRSVVLQSHLGPPKASTSIKIIAPNERPHERLGLTAGITCP